MTRLEKTLNRLQLRRETLERMIMNPIYGIINRRKWVYELCQIESAIEKLLEADNEFKQNNQKPSTKYEGWVFQNYFGLVPNPNPAGKQKSIWISNQTHICQTQHNHCRYYIKAQKERLDSRYFAHFYYTEEPGGELLTTDAFPPCDASEMISTITRLMAESTQ